MVGSRGIRRKAPDRKRFDPSTRTHTTATARQVLYAAYSRSTGKFRKYGITSDINNRYGRNSDYVLRELKRGSRREMAAAERKRVIRFGGPDNREPWVQISALEALPCGDNRMHVLNFGYIAKGPGLARRPVTQAIMRLARESSAPSDAVLHIAYVIPGRLGRQESAFEVRRERGGAVVFVAVPEQLVAAPDPLGDLLLLAKEAIERAGVVHPAVDVAAAEAELDRIARNLGAGPLALLRPAVAFTGGSTEVHDAQAAVAVDYLMSDHFDFDAGAVLEAKLAAELSRKGLASVDGNEVGGGVYTIVIHGRDIELVQEAAVSAISRLGLAKPWRIRTLIG